jgi:hypothetical protein
MLLEASLCVTLSTRLGTYLDTVLSNAIKISSLS